MAKTNKIRKKLKASPHLMGGELVAINAALDAAAEYGYGNVMAWLATEWAVILRDCEGMSEKSAIDAVSGRGPYTLPK